MSKSNMKFVTALFGTFKDAFHVLIPAESDPTESTSVIDANDTVLALTGEDDLQLFVPANGKISDRGLAIVQIYNAMCRDKVGVVDKEGNPIPENEEFSGFTQPFIDAMKDEI